MVIYDRFGPRSLVIKKSRKAIFWGFHAMMALI
jgi:hypothetical protein